MQTIVYILNFKTQYTQLDNIKIGGALLERLLELYPEKYESILECFKNSKIGISDALPYKNSIMFPFPKVPVKARNEDQMPNLKKIVKNISLDQLRKIIGKIRNNEDLYVDDMPDIVNKNVPGKEYNSLMDEAGVKIYREPITRERKTIYTDVFTKEYFSSGELEISGDGKIKGPKKWVVFNIEDDCKDLEKGIRTSLYILSDLGLSGRRAIGKGIFTIEALNSLDKSLEFSFNGEGYYILLSKFIPREDEIEYIDFKRSYYTLDIFSGLDKKGISLGIYRYITPGSIMYLKKRVVGVTISLDSIERIIPFNGIFLRVV